MQIPVIKELVTEHASEVLEAAEEAILEGRSPVINIDGEDEGEQLTHIMAAIWVKKEMEKEGIPLNKAVRNYTVKVRKSIS
jgi:hypothetical protein